MVRLIRRYPKNRRLYDTHEKRYVSLPHLQDLVTSGHQIRVTVYPSGFDVTTEMLLMILVGMERAGNPVDGPAVMELIRTTPVIGETVPGE